MKQEIIRPTTPRYYGKYRGVVVNSLDPDGLGRIQVRVPAVLGDQTSGWALPCLPYDAREVGLFGLPGEGESVWIEFEEGDLNNPIWTGYLFTPAEVLPEQFQPGVPRRLFLKTETGLMLTLDDLPGACSITIQTAGNQKIILMDNKESIDIENSSGDKIRMDNAGIRISSPGNLALQASTIEISAGLVQVNTGMAKFSGVVQSDTLITNSVISSSYSPGAGNIA